MERAAPAINVHRVTSGKSLKITTIGREDRVLFAQM